MSAIKLFTYGYGSVPIERIIEDLKRSGVSHVVDVRLSPNSRNPAYRRKALEASLKTGGILYTHLPELGNINYKGGGPIALSEPSVGLPRLHSAAAGAYATGGAVAILCVCAKPAGCHRRLISDTMQSKYEVEVVDL